MFDVAGDLDPFVLAFLPHGDGWGDEIGVVERAEGDRDLAVGVAVVLIIYGRATVGAEVEISRAVFAGGGEGGGPARDDHLVGGEADLCGKGAAAALLAIEAMTDRDAGRRAGRGGDELAAAAGGGVDGYDLQTVS